MRIATTVSCLTLSALSLAWLPASAQTNPATDNAARTAASSDTPDAAKSNKTARKDRVFLEKLAYANLAEIEGGKIAQDKATDSNVKMFGQHMAEDHSKALAELTELATRKGVTLPTEPDAKHKKMAERLKSLSGPEFNAVYMQKAGIEDHQAVLKLLKQIQKEAKDPEVKALAAKMQPTVEEHLKMSQDMNLKK